MQNTHLTLIICLTLVFADNILFAQTTNDTTRSRIIDEVVVIGNYNQEALLDNPLLEQRSLFPNMSKVTKDNIFKEGGTTLIDALKYTPGAWIETRGRKVKQVFSVRGQAYPYPSFAINGIWQKEFTELSYFFNSANIESITINRSSSALLNSLTALSGSIDVKTIQPTKQEVSSFAKYGSLNSYQTGVSYADATEDFNYIVAVNGNGTNGIDGMNGQENMLNAMSSFNWKLSSKLEWSMNLFYIYGKRELVLPIEPADEKFFNLIEEYDPYKAVMVSSKLKYKHSDKFTSELLLSYTGRQPLFKRFNIASKQKTEYKEIENEFLANWINALALSSENTLRFGLLYNYWLVPEGKCFYYGNKAKTHTVSAVVTDQQQFGRLLVDAGFRLTGQYYEDWGGFHVEGATGPFSTVDPIEDEWQSPEWQATAGLTYSFNNTSSVHFSFAGGVVAPRGGSLTDAGVTPDNETRLNFDLGYHISFASQARLSISTFLVKRNNAIEYSNKTIEKDNGDILELYKNVDMRNYGVELDFHSPRFFNAFSFFTNAAFMLGEVDEKNDWNDDDEIPNIIANLGVNFQKGAFDANGYLNYTGEYKNDRWLSKNYLNKYGKAPLGDFTTVDFTAGYRFGKTHSTRVFVEAKNIFDNEYQAVVGYPDYGRILSIGFNIKL